MDIKQDHARPGRLIGRASVVFAGTAYQQAMSFLSGLVVARVIGASDYGIFTLARNLLDLAAIVCRLGLDVGLQRHFGESNAVPDRTAHMLTLQRVRLLSAFIACLPLIALALGLGRFVEQHVYRYPHFADILLCLALALPFLTDLGILGGAYRGLVKLSAPVLAECVLLPTLRLAAVLLLFAAGWRLWAVVVGTTLGSLLASAFLASRARSDFRVGGRIEPYQWGETFRVVRYSCVLAGVVLVATFTNSMDVLMLGRFATAADLGQYSLVKMLLVPMGVFGIAFSQGLGGLLAERHVRGDHAGMVHIMSLNARLVALLTLPMFALFLFWGARLTPLFGPSFAISQTVVGCLAAAQYFFIIFSSAGWALSMTGRHVLELKILLIGLVLSAFLCVVAVPAYGQLGAAVAASVSMVVANVLRLLFVRRSLGSFPLGSDVIVITFAGVALAWTCNTFVGLLALPAYWETACGATLFLVSYAALCWSQLLSEPERAGIHAAVERTLQKVLAHGH